MIRAEKIVFVSGYFCPKIVTYRFVVLVEMAANRIELVYEHFILIGEPVRPILLLDAHVHLVESVGIVLVLQVVAQQVVVGFFLGRIRLLHALLLIGCDAIRITTTRITYFCRLSHWILRVNFIIK